MNGKRPARVLVGATGSIAILQLPAFLGALRSVRLDLKVVLTPTADRFLPAATLAHLIETVTDGDPGDGHVRLSRWADLLVVLPCTAHTLSNLAHGAAPNLLTSTALAHRRPLLIVPAMNADMWASPAVRRNVATLREDGHHLVEPVAAQVYEAASGGIVPGIAPPPIEELVATVKAELRGRLAPMPRECVGPALREAGA
ncbi:flavoprotein [Actinomadura macra]|uniref:flavoprotein n=1 Tax=Actinomadura macra TaxID=46164 RepID=UPI00083215CE|nr:flavoprotein [Actinomadura macra]